MLLKTNRDVIEQMRSDPRVREAMYRYRHFLKAQQTETDIIESMKLLQRADAELDEVIRGIAEIYQEMTSRSPRTTNVTTGNHPFSTLVIELFKQEGLDPPSAYAIRKAIKKSK